MVTMECRRRVPREPGSLQSLPGKLWLSLERFPGVDHDDQIC